MFSVLFMYGVAEHFRAAGGPGANDAISQNLRDHYTGFNDVMTSLFMSITGGVDWQDVLRDWREVSWAYGPIFIFFIFVMHFGVLNVVMATFVAATAQIASKDRDQIVKNEIAKMGDYMGKVTEFFKEADSDGSGSLSWDEFQSHMEKPHVKAYFQALDMDVSQAHNLFEMLDADSSNSVNVDEFIEGCVRLRGAAKSVDVSMILMQCKKVSGQLEAFQKTNLKQLTFLQHVLPPVPPLPRSATPPPVARQISKPECSPAVTLIS